MKKCYDIIRRECQKQRKVIFITKFVCNRSYHRAFKLNTETAKLCIIYTYNDKASGVAKLIFHRRYWRSAAAMERSFFRILRSIRGIRQDEMQSCKKFGYLNAEPFRHVY